MKISLNWLKDYVALPDLTAADWAEKITLHVCEVEGVLETGKVLAAAQVVEVLEIKPHPNAENLSLVLVNNGKAPFQVVCGAKNFAKGDKVAHLPVGTELSNGMKLDLRKIRGIESPGMLAAEDELDLTEDHQGLFILPADAPLGKRLDEVFPDAKDWVFEIDNKAITHRPDLWGHYGFARELAALLDLPLKPFLPQKPPLESLGKQKPALEFDVRAKDWVPRFSALALGTLEVKPSPNWMRHRLQRVGIRPINNLVDVTNYLMLDLGQPMHAFDYAFLKGRKVEIDFAKDGDNFASLYAKDVRLTKQDLAFFIDRQAVSLAGILGGKDSGIQDDSRAIVLEAANWDASLIRRTAARHGLRTDAAQRFEKHLDPHWTELAIAKAYLLLQQTVPKLSVESKLFDVWHKKEPTRQLDYNPGRAGILLYGTTGKLTAKEQKKILLSLGFDVETVKDDLWKVTVPSWRRTRDMFFMQDLVEEVGRMQGYFLIEPKSPTLELEAAALDSNLLGQRKAKAAALHLGYHEVMLNPLSYPELEQLYNFELPAGIEILNPVTKEQTELRQTLLSGILEAAKEQWKEAKTGKFFGFAKTYAPADYLRALKDDKQVFYGDLRLGLARFLGQEPQEEAFFAWKQDLIKISQAIGLVTPVFTKTVPASYQQVFHPEIVFSIEQASSRYGFGGKISPLYNEKIGLKGELFYAEWHLNELFQAKPRLVESKDLGKYPPSFFDLTLTVDKQAYFGVIRAQIIALDLPQLVDVVYVDSYLKEEQKNLTIQAVFRSLEATLSSAELQKLQTKLMEQLEAWGYRICKSNDPT